MKYIILNEMFPVIFSEALTHSHVAKGIPERITSAGFCRVDNVHDDPSHISIRAFGQSVSLGLQSLPEDSDILTSFMNKEI